VEPRATYLENRRMPGKASPLGREGIREPFLTLNTEGRWRTLGKIYQPPLIMQLSNAARALL